MEQDNRVYFPLSESQRNIWNLEKIYPDTAINHISTTIRIRGKVDLLLLGKSINLVLKADETLRMRITLRDDAPVQYCVPYEDEAFEIFDFSQTDREGMESWEEGMSREPFPLLDAPLCRFILFSSGENSGGVFLKLHHIISDGWSQMLVCNRIAQAYLDLLAGKEPTFGQIPSYSLHLEEERRYRESSACIKDRAYWKKCLEGGGEPVRLSRIRGAAVSPMGRRESFALPRVLNHAIYLYCLNNRVAPFAVFYMALAVYFRRIGASSRFTLGVPVINRTSFVFKQSTGMFVNTLPFFNEIQDEWSLNDFNASLAEAWYELLRHQRFPFEQIRRLAAEAGKGEERLFNIAFSYQDSQVCENRDASVVFSGRWHYSGCQAEQLCIHLTNMEKRGEYRVDYDYQLQLFTREEIRQLHENLVNILMEALQFPDTPICRLAVIDRQERERVLYSFNRTDRYSGERGLYAFFERQVRDYPDRAAVIYEGRRVSYSRLARQAEAIAQKLEEMTGKKKVLAAVKIPRSPLLLAAMLGILRAGSAYLLLSGSLPIQRIRQILRCSGARLILTGGEAAQDSDIYEEAFGDLPTLRVDECGEAQEGGAGKAGEENGGELAYVVYTSGSTGRPKGVQITRKNLGNLVQAMAPYYGKGAVLSVCNIGFDAFTLESICALCCGRTIVLPGEEELESPRLLAGLIRGYGVGFMCLTPSRLQAFLKDASFCLSIRDMETIICGGETFPPQLLKKLKQCTRALIYNQYGPSETTVAVSMKKLNDTDRITVGKPMDNCRLYVLDPWMNPLPVGVYGQLYVGGLCVGAGYRPDAEKDGNTAAFGGENGGSFAEENAAFMDSPFEVGERLYATGDKGAWTRDGEIVLAGRMDEQIKLRGLRVEPGEVAACIASWPGVRQAAARVWERDGRQLLAAYYCADRDIPEEELVSHAARSLPEYMIPSFVIRIPSIPLTDRGKVDTDRLPEPVFDGRKTELCGYPVSDGGQELAEKIAGIFAQVLGNPRIHADSDFFRMGGNSLNAMEVLSSVEELTGKRLRISRLYACRTARRLAGSIEGKIHSAQREKEWTLSPAPVLDCYPLTPIQQGIYVQSEMDPEGMAYHMPGAFCLHASVDGARLEAAFIRVIQEDPIFRTAFCRTGDGVCARVSGQTCFHLERPEGNSLTEAAGKVIRPFRLDEAPLLRAGLWEKNGEQILILDVHHIIGDGLSTSVLMKRLEKAYELPEGAGEGGRKEEARIPSYLDYAHARMTAKDPVLCGCSGEDGAYWKQCLTPVPQPLLLPADRPRGKRFDYKGKNYTHRISAQLSARCKTWCAENGISVYMLFLGAYALLLASVSGHEDVVVGTPVSGRDRAPLREICGPFINTMPVRLRVNPKEQTGLFLERVRTAVNGMLEHPSCTLEEMIDMLKLPRSFSGNPLYQAAFSMRPFEADRLSLAGGRAEYIPIPTGTAKTELFLELAEDAQGLLLEFEYASSLFEEATIRLYAGSVETIVDAVTEPAGRGAKAAAEHVGGERRLEELPLLACKDRLELLEMPNYRYLPYLNQPIHQMIRNRARMMPQAEAVIFHGKTTTFRELEERAAAIAFGLHEDGAVRGERVGLSMERSPLLLAGMLGILGAGCAYVPLSPELPARRMSSICADAQIQRILCSRKTLPMLEKTREETGCRLLDGEAMEEGAWEDGRIGGEDLIHVLFTSGSTGKPKGVMLRHRSLSSLYANMRRLMEPVRGTVLCTAGMTFDIFIVESLFPLAMGLSVVLADEEEMGLPFRLAELIEKNRVQFLQLTASRLQLCLGNHAFRKAAAGLRLVISGGETLSRELAEDFFSVSEGTLLNMYGPTEAAVAVTAEKVEPGGIITIGRALDNCRVYVLDEAGRPVMPTAVGELVLAGEGIADGYIGNEELTRQAFLPDLYFPDRKMYRSGDLGRLRADGRIEFLGRRDEQIKVNGQRMEPEEIRQAMLASGLASQAAVTAVKKPEGTSLLAAFYVPVRGKEADGDRDAMLRWLSDCLPASMVPSVCRRLEEIPLNANGKTDVQKLKQLLEQPEETAQNTGSTPLSGDESHISRRLAAIWEKVLGHGNLKEDLSFFRQGGTSLGALNVLSLYYNEGLEMGMARFYENPTIRAQAALLAEKGTQTHERGCGETELRVPEPLSLPVRKGGLVFITGATGFFGAHLLRELLKTEEGPVVCLVRGGRKRLLETLTWYFGAGWTQSAARKIRTLEGDLTLPRLGLSDRDWEQLADRVERIYHCAADVRHFASDEKAFLDVNLGGTRQMIDLARRAGAALMHVSTASVAGDHPVRTCGAGESEQKLEFTETDLDIGQNWKDNIYVRSKFLAEAEVYRAVQGGLCARVFRLGRVTGRTGDQVFQKNPKTNASWLLMRSIACLGVIPESMRDYPVDMVPVDWCARALLTLQAEDMTVFHLMNPDPPCLYRLAQMLVPDLRLLPDEDYTALLRRRMGEGEKTAGILAPLLQYMGNPAASGPQIRISCSATWEKLRSRGNEFELPPAQVLAGGLGSLTEAQDGEEYGF